MLLGSYVFKCHLSVLSEDYVVQVLFVDWAVVAFDEVFYVAFVIAPPAMGHAAYAVPRVIFRR